MRARWFFCCLFAVWSGWWGDVPKVLATESEGIEDALESEDVDAHLPVRLPPLPVVPVLEPGVYRVRSGDTLTAIARRHGLSLRQLLALNPQIRNPHLIYPGQEIYIGFVLPPEPVPPQPTQEQVRYIWPTRGILTGRFGDRRQGGRIHRGIDIANAVGTPIVAAADGWVRFSGWHPGGYGYLVVITHADGSETYYAHNLRNWVHKGQWVRQGQMIAEMGSTGFSTGPHLHFEIRRAHQALNPIPLLPFSS